MTPEERIERTEANLHKLTGVVATLAETVVAHDNQIEANDRQIAALIENANRQSAETAALKATIADLARQWQGYINTPPRQ